MTEGVGSVFGNEGGNRIWIDELWWKCDQSWVMKVMR